MESFGVLLLAYGGPNSLDDVPAFLRHVRGGQSVPQPVIDEMTRRYRLIGGRSPLLDITRRLAAKLQNALGVPVYVGMRHWHPFISDTVQMIARDGISRAIAICLTPHFSPLSVGAYRAALGTPTPTLPRLHPPLTPPASQGEQAQTGEGELLPPLSVKLPTGEGWGGGVFDFVESWHTQPRYIEGIARSVQTALAQLPSDAQILFTAHTLPVSAREPYESQLRETAQLVAAKLSLRDDRWMLCYQSKPRAPGDWLDPQIEQLVPELARAGATNLVIAPIGFVADHLEVLYDLDIALQEIARANDVRVVRTPMFNDDDALVNALSELVRERITQHATRNT